MSKLFSFNLDDELKTRLISVTEKKYTKMGPLINRILMEWLNNYEEIVVPLKKVAPPRKERTYEEHIKDWEWRKEMVLQAKLPIQDGDEYPRYDRDQVLEPDVYMTSDGEPLGTMTNGVRNFVMTPDDKKMIEGKAEMERLAQEEYEKEKKRKERDELLKLQKEEKELAALEEKLEEEHEETQEEMEDREFD